MLPSWLAETYVPRSRPRDAAASASRARAAAEELSRDGAEIRYIRTTFLPGDETCFHLFEAASAEAVDEVVNRAALGRARVIEVIEEPTSGGPES